MALAIRLEEDQTGDTDKYYLAGQVTRLATPTRISSHPFPEGPLCVPISLCRLPLCHPPSLMPQKVKGVARFSPTKLEKLVGIYLRWEVFEHTEYPLSSATHPPLAKHTHTHNSYTDADTYI